MKIFFTVILLSLPQLLQAQFVTASRPCSIEERTTKSGGSYVRFTGRSGQRTDILYAPHMDPALLAEMNIFISAEIKTPTHFKMIKELANKIKATQRDVVAAKRRELATLDELTENEKVRWLAVELPETDVAKMRKHLVLEKIRLEKLLTDAGVSLRDSDDLVLLMHDSVQYWLTSAPDRIKTYNYVGIENEKEHTIAVKSAEKIEKLKGALREYASQIQAVNPENMKGLDLEIGHILGEKRILVRESEKLIVQRFPSSESQSMAQSTIQAARDLVLASRKRDQQIAERVNHGLSGNGILTIGRAHKDSLAEYLVQTCERQPQANGKK